MPEVKIETYSRKLCVDRFYMRGDQCLTYRASVIRQRVNALARCWIDGRRVAAFPEFSSRLAWCNRQFFVKMDTEYSNHDQEQSQSDWEWRTWEENKTYRFARYLVPVLAHGITNGFHWVIQPKVEFLPDEQVTPDMQRSAWKKIFRLTNTLNLLDVGELHNEGWAINARTGEPVIYNYGF